VANWTAVLIDESPAMNGSLQSTNLFQEFFD